MNEARGGQRHYKICRAKGIFREEKRIHFFLAIQKIKLDAINGGYDERKYGCL